MTKSERAVVRISRACKGYICDIAARHELGNTDVQVFASKEALKKYHSYYQECGGITEIQITWTVENIKRARLSRQKAGKRRKK